MHEFQHIITGHSAVGSIKQALGIDDGDVVNQSDDLSIGPLGDVDAAQSPLRAAFWREVWGEEPFDPETGSGRSFEDELAAVTRGFRDLPNDPRPCLVWYGTGANEQLTPRRAAFSLRGSPKEIWVAEALPEDQPILPTLRATAVAICIPPRLIEIYDRRRRLERAERERLAADWETLCREGGTDTMRHFGDSQLETRSIENYDQRIVSAAENDWGGAARFVGHIMGYTEDAFVSDVFIFWRIRELARRGILEIDLPDAPMWESCVRRTG